MPIRFGHADYRVRLERRCGFVSVGSDIFHDENPDTFVEWCRNHGVKLRPVRPTLYAVEFFDDLSREVFERRWMGLRAAALFV